MMGREMVGGRHRYVQDKGWSLHGWPRNRIAMHAVCTSRLCVGAVGICMYSHVAWKWTHWDLDPGPSACEADVILLHHVPSDVCVRAPAISDHFWSPCPTTRCQPARAPNTTSGLFSRQHDTRLHVVTTTTGPP